MNNQANIKRQCQAALADLLEDASVDPADVLDVLKSAKGLILITKADTTDDLMDIAASGVLG